MLIRKRADWKRLYDWEFAQFAEFKTLGDTIASATITADAGITIGAEVHSGSRVQALVEGGTAGTVYNVTCEIVTGAGRILSTVDQFEVF